MKIVSGRYRGRVIPTFKDADYRPSTTKFREAVFSIMSSGMFAETRPIEGAKVLDLFAGSGSLSFEALSRGAQNCTLIDTNVKYLEEAKKFASMIGAPDLVTTMAVDACNLPYARHKYDVIFMDPPYNTDYMSWALKSLVKNGWLEEGAIIIAELESRQDYKLDDCFELFQERSYGKNKLLIMGYGQKQANL